MAGKVSKASNRSVRLRSSKSLKPQLVNAAPAGLQERAPARSFKSIGSMAFLFGAMIALLTGVLLPGASNVVVTSLLVVLGAIAGFLNVTKKETTPFLIATVSLVIVASLGGDHLKYEIIAGRYLEGVFRSLLTFVIPATIIVALKQVYNLEED